MPEGGKFMPEGGKFICLREENLFSEGRDKS
jgi:hypothetical protein